MHAMRFVRWLSLAVTVVLLSAAAFAQIGISISIGPPALPVYEQPPCPAEGYIWTPGYWAYDYDAGDYYWVPGTWVLAPEPGFLWTPPWWGWGGVSFIFHEGFWGPAVGFYGGIDYGFGYFGHGYDGGRWQNGQFFYNQSVNNVNVTNIRNVYNTTVVNNSTTVNRVSYNGGNGGVTASPTAAEEAAAREKHISPVAAQTQHVQAARSDPQLRASANQGKPPIAATQKPGELKGGQVVAAREAGGPYHPPANRAEGRPNENAAARPENNVPRPPAPTHAADVPSHPRPAPPYTGNTRQDQRNQQQQENLYKRQEQEHQRLAQQQQQEHQRAQQNADQARTQQMEQRHQQQTQQMENRHFQQQQQMQQRVHPPQNPGGPPHPGEPPRGEKPRPPE